MCRELLTHDTQAQIKYLKEPSKDTALHLAGRKRDNDMVKMFIEAGSVVDGKNVSDCHDRLRAYYVLYAVIT